MFVKNLSDTSFEIILDCFLKAFENYFVKMPTDKDYYKRRWQAAKVDFNCSYGMFDGEKLVGFIIHAIDKRNGKLTAFNTGTGVIPEYRGKGMVKSIYKHAFNDLAEKGIEKSVLEVITKNDIAVSLYKSIGFNICKTYKCFNGNISIDEALQADLREVALPDVDWNGLPNQSFYSWDNQQESILNGDYRYFEVVHNEKPESFFVINPDQNYLAQFDLLTKENKGWQRLFTAIKKMSVFVKINNVDLRLKEKLDGLISVGLENTVDQFEMEINIKERQ